MRSPIVVHVVPPAQTDQQASGDVFHGPEIGGQQEDDKHETSDERIAEPATEHVGDDRGASEEQMKEHHVRMTV